MKSSNCVGFLILIIVSTSLGSTQKLKVPRLKVVGGANSHLVLAQTSPEFVEKNNGFTILRKHYIAQWNNGRFEYGMAQFQCRLLQCEILGEPVALKFYKECTGFKKGEQPSCKNMESARIDVTDPYANLNQSKDKRNWYTCEDYGAPCVERGTPDESSIQNNSEYPNISIKN